jgi:hypothetical protein
MPPTSEGLAGGENRQLLSLESILPHLQGVRRLANGGYMARCPVHDDTNPSLSLREENGKLLWKCFAGCSQEAVQRELERRVGIPRETDRPSGQEDYTPVKLDELADAFELTAEKLRAYGVRDIPAGYAPEAPKGGIEIPYLTEQGELRTIEYRRTLEGDDRFRWKTGTTPILYGLWRLPEWRDADTLYLCEGVSDTWVLWEMGLPALGIPSASTWRKEWWDKIKERPRIVIIPDNDAVGIGLVKERVAPTCPESIREQVYVLQLPSGVKDANERWLQVDANPERFKEALAACEVKPLLEYVDRPIESESQDEQESQDEPIELVLVLGHTREREVAHTIVPNLLYAERITIRAGESGVGKTTFALEIADALTRTGKLWNDTVEVQPAKVLWLDFDHSWGRLQEILEREQSCSWCVSESRARAAVCCCCTTCGNTLSIRAAPSPCRERTGGLGKPTPLPISILRIVRDRIGCASPSPKTEMARSG